MNKEKILEKAMSGDRSIENKYCVDVFTPNSARTFFPEQSYKVDTIEECAEIIRNCSRPIAGIAKIEVWIPQNKI